MKTKDGELVVVFNGEIYNFVELRRELEQLGHRFISDHSDTEILLHGYRQWGQDLVEHLNGMFAFCLYDRQARKLFFGRDRFGKKPLFYAETPHGLVFASEAKALLRHPAVDDRINDQGLLKYFAYGFIPAPLTLYAAIRKLPGGHTMSYDMASRRIETRCYWRYRVVADDPPPGTVETWAEELRELLTLAVERRLRTDVPFGFFLSGGVDSSAIVALAARRLDPAAMKTFTIGFDEPSYDESPYARTIADHFGTDHFQQILNLEKAAELLPELMRRQDDPIADNSLLATHLLSRFAREQVTVALSGDGSDELFAGYDTFDALRPAQLYQAMVPSALHRLIAAGADQLPRSDRNMSFDFKLRRALRGLEHPSACWMPAWLGPTSIADLEILFERELDPEDVYSEAIDLWGQSASSSLVDRSLEFYARYYLGENLLIKADRASMYCSLEVRSPFLDRDVVDFVLRLPVSMKYRRGARKWILKQAMKPLLPESILERPKKGFGIPTTAWLRHLPAPEPAAATALGLNGTWLSKQWDDHRRGRADHRSLLWAWLSVSAAAA